MGLSRFWGFPTSNFIEMTTSQPDSSSSNDALAAAMGPTEQEHAEQQSDDFEIVTVDEDGRVTLPVNYRKELNIVKGTKLKVEKEPGPSLSLEKLNVPLRERIASYKYAIRFAFFAAVLMLAPIISVMPIQAVDAQEQPVPQPQPAPTEPGAAIPPVLSPTSPGTCYTTSFDASGRPLGQIMTIPIQSSAAYLPFRMEITYPKGDNSTFYLSTIPSSQSNYANTELVNQGIASRIFSTDFSVDNFSFVVGQRYNLYQNQIVRIAIFANSTNPLPGIIIPFCGYGFAFQINVITSLPPRQPTPEEINAPVLIGINELRAAQTSHNVDSENWMRVFGLAANGYLASMLPNIAIAVVGFANMLGLLYLIKRTRDRQNETGTKITTDGYTLERRQVQQPRERTNLLDWLLAKLRLRRGA